MGLQRSEVYLRATNAWCDCGVFIGRARFAKPWDLTDEYLRDVKAKRRKGWKSAKIHAWIDAKLGPREQAGLLTPEARVEAHFANPPPPPVASEEEAGPWIHTIRSALDIGIAHVGLLVHDYSRSEAPVLSRSVDVSVDELTREFLPALEPDVLYRFVSRT